MPELTWEMFVELTGACPYSQITCHNSCPCYDHIRAEKAMSEEDKQAVAALRKERSKVIVQLQEKYALLAILPEERFEIRLETNRSIDELHTQRNRINSELKKYGVQ